MEEIKVLIGRLRDTPDDSTAFIVLRRVIDWAKSEGYTLRGSVLKIDFSSSGWAVGLWLRPCLETQYKNGKYTAPFYCGSVKSKVLSKAVIELLTELGLLEVLK